MNVAIIHNYYQQPGGEDLAFSNEYALLQQARHHVVRYTVHNDQVTFMNGLEAATRTVWHQRSYRELSELVRTERIDVCHFHNTFPLVSPAAYYAAVRAGASVVQTLHNYRLICPAATLYRNGATCEECLHAAVPWPAVKHRCYRSNAAASAATAAMLSIHRGLGTWNKMVDRYIALTEFARTKLIEGGLPADRVVIKKNFLQDDPGQGAGDGDFALFIGRLTVEKGIRTLLQAWRELGANIRLKIIGDGPLRSEVQQAAAEIAGVDYLGRVDDAGLDQHLGAARFLVFPSEWYEGLPRTIIEAFAKGTPVIGSHIGSVADLIIDGETGWRFQPGDVAGLVGKALWMTTNPAQASAMRNSARQHYLREYTAESNYPVLMSIYQEAINRRRGLTGSVLAPAGSGAR
jgi:glycosyltransferase involved in cell wall biosynthesis